MWGNLAYHELNDATDIVLGCRGGVLRNELYRVTIQDWAPRYANAKRGIEKKDVVHQIHSQLMERGLRFLVQVGVGFGVNDSEYALVTDESKCLQRIQRSLQEYSRRQAEADQARSIPSVSKSNPDVELGNGESVREDNKCSTSNAPFRLVTGNSTRSGTPIPLLLERKSSAFTISDASIDDLLSNDHLLRQISGIQTNDAEADLENPPSSNVPTAPHPSRSWPDIHLDQKSSDAIDAVSLITECSTSPGTPRRSSTDESTIDSPSTLFPPNVTSSKGPRTISHGSYRLPSRQHHPQHRLERMVFDMLAEMQTLRARVAAKEGELHAMEERVTIVEEQLRRQQREQEPQSSTEGWPTVG